MYSFSQSEREREREMASALLSKLPATRACEPLKGPCCMSGTGRIFASFIFFLLPFPSFLLSLFLTLPKKNIKSRLHGPFPCTQRILLNLTTPHSPTPSQHQGNLSMPKSSNSHAAQGSSHTAAMLNQDNLEQHTQHHQELDESRDFVREFLETLDPSSAPQSDPGLEPVELTSDIMLRSPSVESKSRALYDSPQRLTIRPAQQQTSSQYQHQQSQTQQNKQKKYQQQQSLQVPGQQQAHNNSLDKPKRKKVSKEHMDLPKRTHQESQPILQDNRKHPVSTTRRKEGNGVVGKDDTRQSKKRKQDVDDVEQGVHDLDIRDPNTTDNTSSRVKRKRKTEGSSTRLRGPTTTKGKQGTFFYGPKFILRVVVALV